MVSSARDRPGEPTPPLIIEPHVVRPGDTVHVVMFGPPGGVVRVELVAFPEIRVVAPVVAPLPLPPPPVAPAPPPAAAPPPPPAPTPPPPAVPPAPITREQLAPVGKEETAIERRAEEEAARRP